jgi:hypothetical protein
VRAEILEYQFDIQISFPLLLREAVVAGAAQDRIIRPLEDLVWLGRSAWNGNWIWNRRLEFDTCGRLDVLDMSRGSVDRCLGDDR